MTFYQSIVSRPRLLASAAVLVLLASVDASAADMGPRPCGPDSLTGPLRMLIPQGVGGADFRPACRRHDACYDTPGSNKTQCDRRYRREMLGTCRNSRHPILCRMTANLMYGFTAFGGDEAFVSAQRIAAGLSGR